MAQQKIIISKRGLGELAVRLFTASGEVADEAQARRILRDNPYVADRYRRMAEAVIEAAPDLPGGFTLADPWLNTVLGPEDVARMPQDDGVLWRTPQGQTIRWDGDRSLWHLNDPTQGMYGYFTADGLRESLSPLQYPLHRNTY